METRHTKVEMDRLIAIANYYKINALELLDTSDNNINFNEKVENGYASYNQTNLSSV